MAKKSESLFREAQEVLPGGVNSPVRAYKAMGGSPPFIKSGWASHIIDVDDREYIDYVLSWGPLILGHRPAVVVEALRRCLEECGTSFGAPTELETEMAQLLIQAVPSLEMVRMVNSGTEATMSALRLARAYTGRSKVLKFEGCYHGHADYLLISAGSGAATLGVPTSPGVPVALAGLTMVAPYNDLEVVEQIFAREGEDVAAVIVEPVAGNMGCVPPVPGFLEGLRNLTRLYGSLLIFDEVMTGFRVAYGGAQKLFGVFPDLTCLGKVIGGGLPVGAYGGRRDIMSLVAPSGPVYQAGTLSGNPLAMSAGLATLKALQQPDTYEQLGDITSSLAQGLQQEALAMGVKLSVNQVGAMFSCFFTGDEVISYQSASTSNIEQFKVFFQSMLQQGVYLAPSQFESLFTSTAHTKDDIELTLAAARQAFRMAAQVGV